MELVTPSDLLVTASMALLLSFLVAKLVSLAMMVTTTTDTTKHHAHGESDGLFLQSEQQRLTIQSPQIESRVGFISPVQVTTITNVETKFNDIGDATVVSDSNVVVELLPPSTNSNIVFESTEEKTAVVEEKVVPVVEKNEENDDDDWEWEGIERSEMEKLFMAATEFVAEKGYGGDEVEMELYGLHKVATEGPCRESQPMPLKLTARAKWNAWQKLGSMSPEVAMERYISILLDKVPQWMEDASAGMTEPEPRGPEVSQFAPYLSSSLSSQQTNATKRELEQESGISNHSPLMETDFEKNVKK